MLKSRKSLVDICKMSYLCGVLINYYTNKHIRFNEINSK